MSREPRLFIEAHRNQGLHIWWKGRGVHIFLRRGRLKHRISFSCVPKSTDRRSTG